jgi:uncharacterized protein involved in tolerance to divalent cations
LVEDRLFAGGHHIERIRSVYRWDGGIHDKLEARVALHTRTEIVPQLVDRTNAEHPCEVPCSLALPVTSCNKELRPHNRPRAAERRSLQSSTPGDWWATVKTAGVEARIAVHVVVVLRSKHQTI